jgi:Ca2+/Na+ antiporter
MNLSIIVVLGTILAFGVYIVYLIKNSGKAETEKATLENSKVALDSKLEALNQEYLRTEALKRAQEKRDVEEFDDEPDGPSPWLPDPNKGRNPNGYN